MSNSTFHLDDPLNICATVIMIVTGLVGILLNSLIVYIFARSPLERSSFDLMCAFRGASSTIILIWAFFGTFVPITFLGASPFSYAYETVVIGTCNAFYTALQYSGFLIAINRACAMNFPVYYKIIFSFRLTLLFTVVLFGYQIVNVAYELISYVIRLNCFLIYSSSALAWIPYMDPQCNENVEGAVNRTALFLGAMIIVNVATFTKIYLFYKSTGGDENEIKKIVRKNKSLFLQTVLQDAIILADMLFTFRLSLLSEARIWTFFCGTFIWEFVHVLDGFVMIMFNDRLAYLKKAFFKASTTPSSVTEVKVFPSDKTSLRITNLSPNKTGVLLGRTNKINSNCRKKNKSVPVR
ncbi:unnamed protein product [Caenorhabditis sp. 36 PRJEB53466]|nr:unnamed protein product [Caenorhabditis sp. 36 PRJEB53466]